MMNVDSELKRLLDDTFGNCSISQISGGATNAELFKIRTGRGENYILKKQPLGLESEYLNYTWLKGKVPVPEVIFYHRIDDYEVLCMTELKGKPLDRYIGEINEKDIIGYFIRWISMARHWSKILTRGFHRRHTIGRTTWWIVRNYRPKTWISG